MKKFLSGLAIGVMLMSSTSVYAESQKNINAIFGRVKLVVNSQSVEEETLLYNGVTYVPLRAVSETLDKEVSYDSNTSIAYIDEKGTNRKISDNNNATSSNTSTSDEIEIITNVFDLMLEVQSDINATLGLTIEAMKYTQDYNPPLSYATTVMNDCDDLKELDISYISSELNEYKNNWADSIKKAAQEVIILTDNAKNKDYDASQSTLKLLDKNMREAFEYVNKFDEFAVNKYGDIMN